MNGTPDGGPPRYRFADLTLDVGQRRVWRDDRPVPLSNLSFELLRVLVEAAPNVVPHDVLAARAWGPRRLVTPENVAKRVMLLRQSLGDQAAEARYIEGVRGRGYRLLPEVLRAGAPASTARGEAPAVAAAVRRRSPAWSFATAGLLGLAALVTLYDLTLRRAANDAVAADPPFSFVVSAPAGTRFSAAPLAPSPALAPDGRTLAFTAPLAAREMLWLQRLGELEARVVPGTEGADLPFWSRDGRFIAFVAKGRLKSVATEGGAAPQDLAEVTNQAFLGGAWADDGAIVYADTGVLRRLDVGGGNEPLTTLDESRGEFSHRYPAFLPDDEHFVYLVLSTEPEHQGIYLGSLAEPGLKTRLVAGSANAGVGIDARGATNLVFLNADGVLVAQPLDVENRRLNGSPVVVASHPVETGPSVRAAAFSVSGRALAYRPRFAPASRLAWVDRHGVRDEVAVPAGQSYRFPALSDDATRLVAMRDDNADVAGLWWLDLASAAVPERLTRGVELMSAWVPDGHDVVYSLPQAEGWHLLRRAVAGRGETLPLLTGAEPVVKRIRDVTSGLLVFQGSDSDLWLLPLDGESRAQPFMKTPEIENHARVSPNGRWIAFSSTDANETRVYVTSFPEPGALRRVSSGAGDDPQWRSDGRELYYIGPRDVLMAVAVETDGVFTAGTPVPLFDARFDPRSHSFGSAYAVAPGGERFLVAELAQDSEPELVVTLNWARENAAASTAR